MTDEDLDSSVDELVDLGYLEPVGTNADGEVKYRLTGKGTDPPRPRCGKGKRIAENDRVDLVFSSRERDLVLFKTVLESVELWRSIDAGRWNSSNDSYSVPLTLFELEDTIVALITAIHWTGDRQLRIGLSRLSDRLSAINAEYDVISRDDMRFTDNW